MQKKIIVLLSVLFFITISVVTMLDSHISSLAKEADSVIAERNDEVYFSCERGIYWSDFHISCEMNKEGIILYTDNCEIPDMDTAFLYTEPIFVEVDEEPKILVYKFKAFYDDGTESEVFTHTYLTGENMEGRYDTIILSISGEPDDLFSYEKGIFAKGSLWDEYWEENPEYDDFYHPIPANYHLKGADSERPVTIEIFDEKGNSILTQSGGLRIHGGWTRYYDQKSFRLYARKEYDTVNEFNYIFFSDARNEYDGTIIDQYKRLVVRNSGNDNGYGFIRDALISELAIQAGFQDACSVQQAAVYINGEYNGFYWLQTQYGDDYFATKYGERSGSFVVISGSETEKESDDDDPKINESALEYNALYHKYAGLDLTIDEIFEELNKIIDTSNYLQYMAIECYVGNIDWPENNIKAYRYQADDGIYEEGSVFDGRYRYLLYDTDYALEYRFQGWYGDSAEARHLVSTVDSRAPLLKAILEREDCRQYFINYLCNLISGAMSYENVCKNLDDLSAISANEIRHSVEETSFYDDPDLYLENVSMDTVAAEHDVIREYTRLRPESIQSQIKDLFGLADTYQLSIELQEECMVEIDNTLTVTSSFSGTYFAGNNVNLEITLLPDRQLSHWLVNGEIYRSEELTITGDMVQNGIVSVRPVAEEKEDVSLIVSELKVKGNNDYVVLTNPTGNVIKTTGYFLSDDPDNPEKYAIPATTIKAGESLVLYGSNYSGLECLGKIGLNFSLKQGELLIFSEKRKGIIEEIVIPGLHDENSIYRKDILTGKYTEILGGED